MRSLAKKIYKTELGNLLLRPVKKWYYDIVYLFISDEVYLKRRFKKRFGYELDLKKPQTLNAKIQWLKINDRSDLHTVCADKYEVRSFIEKELGEGYLPKLLFQTTNAKDLTLASLPENDHFIIKTNHDSSGGIVVRDKATLNIKKIQRKYKRLLKDKFYKVFREHQYKGIKPRIIVEKLLEDKNGKIPNDYKFHCFNGKAKVVYVSVDREGANKRNIYDINWNPLHFTWAPASKDITNLRGQEIPKPLNFEKMIEIAEKLASHFLYVRVDLFNVDGEIYVGELTFHHGSGFDHIKPKEWDYKLGDMLSLPINN